MSPTGMVSCRLCGALLFIGAVTADKLKFICATRKSCSAAGGLFGVKWAGVQKPASRSFFTGVFCTLKRFLHFETKGLSPQDKSFHCIKTSALRHPVSPVLAGFCGFSEGCKKLITGVFSRPENRSIPPKIEVFLPVRSARLRLFPNGAVFCVQFCIPPSFSAPAMAGKTRRIAFAEETLELKSRWV